MLNRLARALLLLPALAGPAAAQSVAHTQQVAFRLGTAAPLSRYSQVPGMDVPLPQYYGADAKVGNPGFSFGGQYLYNIKDTIGLGLDFEYGAPQAKIFDVVSYRYISKPEDLKLLAVGKYSWLPEYRVRPFGLVGVGVGKFWLKQTQGTAPGQIRIVNGRPDTSTLTLVNNSSTGLAWAFGAGADADLTERWVLTFDLRWSQISISRSRFWGDKYQAMNASLQLGYRIGKI